MMASHNKRQPRLKICSKRVAVADWYPGRTRLLPTMTAFGSSVLNSYPARTIGRTMDLNRRLVGNHWRNHRGVSHELGTLYITITNTSLGIPT